MTCVYVHIFIDMDLDVFMIVETIFNVNILCIYMSPFLPAYEQYYQDVSLVRSAYQACNPHTDPH